MIEEVIEEYYENVPEEQKKKLIEFRYKHPYKEIIINGSRWRYIDTKRGKETIVLLTGGTRIGESYAILPKLEKHYRIISPTYPVAETIDEMVSALERILQQEQLEEYYLLGISMGGMIAQELLRRQQEKIDKAILANTMSPNPKYNPKSARMITLVKLAPKFILNRFIRKQFTESWHEATEEKQAFWKAYYQELSNRYMSKDWILTQFEISFDFSLNYDYTSTDLENWSGKLLIINSDQDTTFDEEIQKHLLGLYPQAETYTIKGAGHVPMLKKEDEYIKIILNFLQA